MDLDILLTDDDISILIGDSCGNVIEVHLYPNSLDSYYEILEKLDSSVLAVKYFKGDKIFGTNRGELRYIKK